MVVGVAGALIGPVRLRSRPTPSEYFSLTLRITNLAAKPVTYQSWSRSHLPVTLRDNNRSYYNRIAFNPEDLPAGAVDQAVIEPGQSITDVLVFEPVGGLIWSLELDLPVEGSEEVYRFSIPMGLVRRVPPPMDFPQMAASEPVPPQPLPPDQDPQVWAEVRAEFAAEMRHVERKINGMGYDRGRSFRRASEEDLLKRLSEKYRTGEDLVRRIVGR
jgi:hypothetical protein